MFIRNGKVAGSILVRDLERRIAELEATEGSVQHVQSVYAGQFDVSKDPVDFGTPEGLDLVVKDLAAQFESESKSEPEPVEDLGLAEPPNHSDLKSARATTKKRPGEALTKKTGAD